MLLQRQAPSFKVTGDLKGKPLLMKGQSQERSAPCQLSLFHTAHRPPHRTEMGWTVRPGHLCGSNQACIPSGEASGPWT